MKLLRTGVTAVALAVSIGGAAQAAPAFSSGLSTIIFNNFENLYRSTDTCTATTCRVADAGDPSGFRKVDERIAGNLAANDIFVGILNISSITPASTGTSTYDTASGSRFTGYFAQKIVSVTPGTGTNAVVKLGTAVDPFGILDSTKSEMFRLFADAASFSSGGTLASSISQAIGLVSGFGLTGNGGNLAKLWASAGLGTEGYGYTDTDLAVAGSGTSFSTAHLALDLITKGANYTGGTLAKINDNVDNTVGGFIADTTSLRCSPAEISNLFVAGVPGVSPAVGAACTDIIGTSRINGNAPFDSTNHSSTSLSQWQFASFDPFQLNKVPEPGSVALMGLALAALSLVRRRAV